ncbi:MAG TPA: hypothetical protein VIK33_15935 [Anaerolineae bacterium]
MYPRRIAIVMAVTLSGFLLLVWGYAPASTNPLDSPLTPTPCPLATPELLAVEPVTSPTRSLSQVVTVRIGNGEAVTVTTVSGVFTTAGSFDVYSTPAFVTVALLTDTTHPLQVSARVRTVFHEGCQYGGYTLGTSRDKLGAPLIIVQVGKDTFLPMILTNAPSAP